MRPMAKLIPLAALCALAVGAAFPAAAGPAAPAPALPEVATGIGWEHRWEHRGHRGRYWDDPPRHWRHHRHWGPPPHAYRPPPRVWYPPPRYYHPPPRHHYAPPPPAFGFYYRY